MMRNNELALVVQWNWPESRPGVNEADSQKLPFQNSRFLPFI